MKKIGFIGAYDKSDLILNIAKIFVVLGKKVLVLDATVKQKCKYVVPVINPVKSYVTEFEGIDVAVGFKNIDRLKQYIGLEDEEELDYDILLIDADDEEAIQEFNIESSDKLYYITSFDIYSLKRGVEILESLKTIVHMKKVFFTKDMTREEKEYFEYLIIGVKVEWDEEELYFFVENGDRAAVLENQILGKIKFKNLSDEYKRNVIYLVNDIDNEIGEKQIRNIIKNL